VLDGVFSLDTPWAGRFHVSRGDRTHSGDERDRPQAKVTRRMAKLQLLEQDTKPMTLISLPRLHRHREKGY
jgi:hypothetical protein